MPVIKVETPLTADKLKMLVSVSLVFAFDMMTTAFWSCWLYFNMQLGEVLDMIETNGGQFWVRAVR